MEIVTPEKKATKPKSCVGTYAVNLPYMIDQWRDDHGRIRVSTHIWLMSGTEGYLPRVRVSGSMTSVVLTCPMCKSFDCDSAFTTSFQSVEG